MTTYSRTSRFLTLLCCGATLSGHVYLLHTSQLSVSASPISQLSQSGDAWRHAVTLAFFATAQALMAVGIHYPSAGSLTQSIRVMALLNALLILSLGFVFTLHHPALHTMTLVIIASFTGIIMACLLARQRYGHTMAGSVILGAFLLIWLALVPVFLVVPPTMTGAYERFVGATYMAWLCAVAFMPLHYNEATDSLTKNAGKLP